MNYKLTVFLISIFIFYGCIQKEDKSNETVINQVVYQNDSKAFSDYWYSGKAEVSSYKLSQSRYGEQREGNAVLIFVTEPFSKSKQVKLDVPEKNPEDKVTVMKMNFTKKFTTGIYPYSMMLSTFTPVDSYNYPKTIKTTMSSQEWCGQSYLQLNEERKGYSVKGFSYFESEGDINKKTGEVILEDELWNRIRLNPEALPQGEISVLPGSFHLRLKHESIAPQKANVALKKNNIQSLYEIDFKNRKLTITFENEFPHKILNWREEITSLGGGKQLTEATLDKTLHIDYWNKNASKYAHLRDSLNLE